MTDVALGLERRDGESWRDVVIRYSRPHGLEGECLHMFDNYLDEGDHPSSAAMAALSDWDCLDLYIDGQRQK